ncbi:retrovirus-related pol polyprotein from transposon TNT 1-94 [Tanacetum coccineum]
MEKNAAAGRTLQMEKDTAIGRTVKIMFQTVIVFKVSSASALQALRRLGTIFTSVYATDQKLKKAYVKSFSSASGKFTNWKKRFMCHIIGIEPQFENIIKNGPFIPIVAGKKKTKGQWNGDERKATNLAKSTSDDLILYHEGPSDVKESRVIDLRLCYNTFKFKESETITQTFTGYKALMNELVNDDIKLSKLEINTVFYKTNKVKTLVFATPLSTAFLFTSILQDIQDSPDDEEDTRSSQEYMNDLEEECQARALLAKSKRFFKKGTQRFSGAKATDQTECHKCGKKGHFAKDCFSKTSIPSYQSPFQPALLNSSENKPELRHTKNFKAKYNKVKVKLAILNSSALAPNSSLGKNKGLIAETCKWDEEEVSSDDNEVIEVVSLNYIKSTKNVIGLIKSN